MRKELKNNPYCEIYKSLVSKSPNVFSDNNRGAKKVADFKRLSARFICIMCKKLDGMEFISGSTAWWSLRAIKGYGACEEKFCPHDAFLDEIHYINFPITEEILENAYQYRTPVYQRLFSLNDIKKVLYLNKTPAIISFDVFKGIYNAPKGFVPLPKANEKKLGAHCVMVAGYSDEKQVISFANSWGEKWGDEGYGYLPYSYLEKYIIECWAVMYKKDWQDWKQILSENNFKDKKGNSIKTQLCKVHPIIYGRYPLLVLDFYAPNGKIGGWSHFSIVDYGNVIEIEEIFLLPQYRNLGWGTKILEIIENTAKVYGISEIRGWVSVQDIVTEERESMLKKYFIKSGFEIVSDNTKFRGSCWRIQKTISKNIYFDINL